MTPLTQIHAEGRVAERYGLEEAIFLHALMFWYRTNRGNGQNFHGGRWWTYNSVKAFEEVFPWWTAGQIRRIIARCREKEAMLTGSFSQDRRDRTAWYTPSDELLELYGESVNCICTNQQMQPQEPADSCAESGNYGDIKLSKKHKDDTERIDPVAAVMNALARALVKRPPDSDINEHVLSEDWGI